MHSYHTESLQRHLQTTKTAGAFSYTQRLSFQCCQPNILTLGYKQKFMITILRTSNFQSSLNSLSLSSNGKVDDKFVPKLPKYVPNKVLRSCFVKGY